MFPISDLLSKYSGSGVHRECAAGIGLALVRECGLLSKLVLFHNTIHNSRKTQKIGKDKEFRNSDLQDRISFRKCNQSAVSVRCRASGCANSATRCGKCFCFARQTTRNGCGEGRMAPKTAISLTNALLSCHQWSSATELHDGIKQK